MSLLIPLACLALLAVFVAAVVQPVMAAPLAWRRQTGSARQRLELTERKEQLYASIKELEFDHRVGKISQDDHDSLRAELESQAVEALSGLRRLESRDPDRGLHRRIEEDVRLLAAGREDAARPSADSGPCPDCGRAREPGHRFCPDCGFRLGDPSPAP